MSVVDSITVFYPTQICEKWTIISDRYFILAIIAISILAI